MVDVFYICTPTKATIYINTGRKTASAIQRELGCDALINGGLFDMRSFTPNCWLRANGQTFHTENWSDWGYGWDKNSPVMVSSDDCRKYQNFISCVAIIKDGQALPLYYPSEIGGVRPRSAIGVKADGRLVLCCTDNTDAMTPEQLRSRMLDLECVSALMLDGGGSSQCITPDGTIFSQRIVHNFIAIWTKPFVEVQNPQCPYSKPTRTLFVGCRGDDVCWTQYRLNQKGFTCDVDGAFGWGTWTAVTRFQKANALFPDGIVGEKTLKALSS